MRFKRTFVLALALATAFAFIFPASLAEGEDAWWQEDVWSLEHLLELGAVPPAYNASSGQYEIGTAEQLLYLSGNWKTGDGNGDGAPDAPCDGTYVLTANIDMGPLMESVGRKLSSLAGTAVKGYMPPIAAETDETAEGGVHCAFFGTFDGQGHAVSNLRIVRLNDKYAGFFGNVGHDYGEGKVKDLALVNIRVECLASCGLLAGGLYGDVENCAVVGSIDCLEKTAGGIAGKVKKNENGYLGTVRDCFVYADITVHGIGSENGAVGGITSAQSDGGRVYNCYVGGSIIVEGENAESVGGITGNLKSGQALENCIMLLRAISVQHGVGVGLLCGDYSGETGSHLANNYVWNGTQLSGCVSSAHPEGAAYASADAATLLSKSFYTDILKWDFANLWGWVGGDEEGYPMPLAFLDDEDALTGMGDEIKSDLTLAAPVLRASEPMTNSGFEGDVLALTCTLTLPEGAAAEGATLRYGMDKDGAAYAASVPMTGNGDGTYTAIFPETGVGIWYYYFEAAVEGRTLTFPSDRSTRLTLEILSAAAKLAPSRITVSPGETYDKIGIAWITAEGELSAELRYRAAGGSEWTIADVTDIVSAKIGGDRGEVTGYSVDLAGLSSDTRYEYMAVTRDGTQEYQSDIYTFTTLPKDNGYSFMVISDLQATTEEGYLPFLYTMQGFVASELGGVDFVVNLGDLTEDGSSMPQWKYMFNTLGEYFATSLNAFVAGNHECSGDLNYTVYKAETNLPGGLDDPYIGETTGSFVVGDACFVMFNTEPYTGISGADTAADKAAYYEAQEEWAQQAFEASGCRWRIVLAHAGLIQDDPAATEFLLNMCDELNVDLYFNGHIHNYYRACARDGAPAEPGSGTTFITTSPMGRKFDDFEPGAIDDILQFQTGGSGDARQYFTLVSVTDEGLVVTAYQLAQAGDDTKAATFASFTPIDSVTLTQSLCEKYAAAEPKPASTEAPAQETQTPPEASSLVIWIASGCAAAAAAAVVVILKKRKKA
ncbi:MAG TPA: metallophosphoesterase family protein [Clostridia bacterium]|nr:metallophosphoesterase family protein [Clostridia bacterium]